MFISNSALLSVWLYWMLQIAYLSTNAVCVFFLHMFLQSFSFLYSKILWVKGFAVYKLIYNQLLMFQQILFVLWLCIYLISYYNYWVRNMLFRCYLQESIMFQQKIFFCICKHLDYQNYYVYILKDREWEMITFICLYWQYFCSFYISVI